MTSGEAAGTERAASWTFAAVVAAALPLYLVLARGQWFFQDEWEFLANRDGGSFASLMRAHNEHWSTLPVLVYRLLWTIFGLRTYLPYQTLSIATHLAVAVLLRVLMRRAGVHPWLATVAAGAFALFGSGNQDIIWGFQIGYVAPVALGSVQLLLTDRDGPVGRRDGLALVVGALALLCSGTAVTMVVVVGLAVLIRRGVWPALVQIVPLAALYLVWWAAYGHEDAPHHPRPGVGAFVRFVTRGLRTMVESFAEYRLVAVLLVLVVVGGVVIAVVDRPPDWRSRYAVPVAMALGTVVFFSITAVGRAAESVTDASKSRYIHIGLALALPAVAVAIDALARRWAVLLIPLSVLLLVGVPANLDEVKVLSRPPFEGTKRDVLALAGSDVISSARPGLRPFTRSERHISAGWLRDGRRSRRIPRPAGGMTPRKEADAYSIVALTAPKPLDRKAAEHTACSRLTRPVVRDLQPFETIRFTHDIVVVTRAPGGAPSSRRELHGGRGAIVLVRRPVQVTISSAERGALCRST
jgi:hypothetical protein